MWKYMAGCLQIPEVPPSAYFGVVLDLWLSKEVLVGAASASPGSMLEMRSQPTPEPEAPGVGPETAFQQAPRWGDIM